MVAIFVQAPICKIAWCSALEKWLSVRQMQPINSMMTQSPTTDGPVGDHRIYCKYADVNGTKLLSPDLCSAKNILIEGPLRIRTDHWPKMVCWRPRILFLSTADEEM